MPVSFAPQISEYAAVISAVSAAAAFCATLLAMRSSSKAANLQHYADMRQTLAVLDEKFINATSSIYVANMTEHMFRLTNIINYLDYLAAGYMDNEFGRRAKRATKQMLVARLSETRAYPESSDLLDNLYKEDGALLDLRRFELRYWTEIDERLKQFQKAR